MAQLLLFTGLFVIRHKDTGEIQYQAREIYRPTLPTNCVEDIADCTKACNDFKLDESFEAIDMYGIVVDDKTEWWEVVNEDEVEYLPLVD